MTTTSHGCEPLEGRRSTALMMNAPEMRRLARVQRFDFWIAIAAILGTLVCYRHPLEQTGPGVQAGRRNGVAHRRLNCSRTRW